MRLYNTPDKQIIDLDLPNNRPVKLYTCGPTVYDFPHIGNWYTFIRYDLLNRVLLANGYKTEWVMNITDVGHLISDSDEGEDKLEKGARREGKSAWDIAKFYGDYFEEGLKRLNFSSVTKLPRATDYIAEQIDLVKKLEEKGYTYQIDDGVYFDTSKFPAYADFAHLNLAAQEEGARVELNIEKRSGSDFALWKLSPKDEQRDMEWDSPWGKGFPGWHLECSAMIHKILGEPVDIHAGGVDHIATHHTNEIAQSVAAYDTPLSRYWMHCNHIMVDGKKMAKSANNFYTLEDIEAKGYSLEVFRLHVLSGHYRSESQFSWDSLEATKNRLERLFAMSDLSFQNFEVEDWLGSDVSLSSAIQLLNSDLNSPQALSFISGLSSNVEDKLVSTNDSVLLRDILVSIDNLLGLSLSDRKDISDDQKEQIKSREAARSNQDWASSDALRDELLNENIVLRDTDFGTVWSRRI